MDGFETPLLVCLLCALQRGEGEGAEDERLFVLVTLPCSHAYVGRVLRFEKCSTVVFREGEKRESTGSLHQVLDGCTAAISLFRFWVRVAWVVAWAHGPAPDTHTLQTLHENIYWYEKKTR